jgi:RNA ligase (TIGR02306 family)
MAEVFVKIYDIDRIEEIENADNLELAYVNGSWHTLVPKGKYKVGDRLGFIPHDCMVPLEVSDKIGCTNYLAVKEGATMGRVRAAKIRGQISLGVPFDPEQLGINPSTTEDLKEQLGIEKHEPSERMIQGDQEKDHPLFPHGYDIQNWRNYPNVFKEGELIIATEKLHGTHSKIGLVMTDAGPTFMVGTHRTRRKLGQGSMYERPLESVKPLLQAVWEAVVKVEQPLNVILLGEIFGCSAKGGKAIQKHFSYGRNDVDFAAFDLYINGKYVDYTVMKGWCDTYNTQTVPVIYQGPLNTEELFQLPDGKTTLMDNPHIREGIVIRPDRERWDATLGRVILKLISNEYKVKQEKRGGTEYH